MTDKEIIIDGVNVAGCIHLECGMCTATRDSYGDSENQCDDYDMADCYYKQLQRTQQQYNQVVEQNKSLQGAGNVLLTEKNALEISRYEYKQECEEYHKQRDNILDECIRYQEKINKFEKENNSYMQALEKIKGYCNYVYSTSEYGNADYTVAAAIEVIINEVLNEQL